jgi:twitching motility protein PilT
MFSRLRGGLSSENRALFERVRARQWKGPGEKQDCLRRIAAVRGASPEDVAALLADGDAAVREAGAALLKGLAPDEAGAALLNLVPSQSPETQKKTFESFVALHGGSLGPESLAELLGDRRSSVALAALDWMRARAAAPAAPLREAALESGVPAVRQRALELAVETRAPVPAAALSRAGNDDDEGVRFEAVRIAAQSPDLSRIPELTRAAGDGSARIRQVAEQALRALFAADPAGWEREVLSMLSDPRPSVRKAAAGLLREGEPSRIVDGFLARYKDAYGPPRDFAIEAFRGLGEGFVLALASRARGAERGVANLAATVAISLDSPEIVPLCVDLLQEPDWWLRHRAAEALARIRDERAMPYLIELLKDRESDVTAAAALGEWGSPRALPGLLEAYKKGAMDLRLEILDAFSKIQDRRVPALFQNIVNVDPEPVVREKALRLLRGLEGHEASEDLEVAAQKFEPLDLAGMSEVTLHDLLRHARAVEASDVHLAVNAVPHLRVHGLLTPLPLAPLAQEQTEAMVLPILSEDQRGKLAESRHIDFCYKAGPLGRFRTNIFFQRKGLDAVFRLVPPEVPRLEDIGFPEGLWEMAGYSQGLILVTGPAGCGKTTTMAAFVDRINRTQNCHIVTIEDPIEFVHRSRQALVTQREIPTHSESFARALRQAFREDPDVIMVGEMRDIETISLAVLAAETGHLVLGTLHTASAAGAVDRMIDAFPPGQQGQIRQMVADSLKAVVAQTLLPRRDGRGRVAAFEVLRSTPAVAGLIREEKTFQLASTIQTGGSAGMQTMDNAMLRLVSDGIADPWAAYDRAARKEAFEPHLPREGAAR